jgi:hypothetical protein
MSLKPSEYDPSKLSIGEPQKTDRDDQSILPITYVGRKLTWYLPSKPEGTPIKENPLKPGALTQGFRLNDPAMVKMGDDIGKQVIDKIIEYRNHKDMPKGLDRYTTAEQLLSFFAKVKLVIHHPKIKDQKTGKSTKDIDPKADPFIYGSLIRKNLSNGGEIFTKYVSASILNPSVEQAIKAGRDNEAKYLYPVVTDKQGRPGLFERRCGMICVPTFTIGDVFVASDKITIRVSLSEVYVFEFKSSESLTLKNMRAEFGSAELAGPEMPDAPAPSEGDDEHEGAPAQPAATFEAPKASSGFTVTVIE